MRDLNPKVAADDQGTFHFHCPFLHLQILSIVFQTFLQFITSNKTYMLKNESIYPFCQFEENPPIFMKLSWSFLFCLFFTLIFIF